MKNTKEALEFVGSQGVVLEAGRGIVPNLADTIAGAPIRGSWWGHPKGKLIFRLTRGVRDSEDILVCRLIDGKVTYVHRRLWPALVRLALIFKTEDLAQLTEIHTTSGAHRVLTTAYPAWVPAEVTALAARLSEAEARNQCGDWAKPRSSDVQSLRARSLSTSARHRKPPGSRRQG